MNTQRTITYASGAWITIHYTNGIPTTYDVSREHGCGAILEQLASMILAGFEGCRKYRQLETGVKYL